MHQESLKALLVGNGHVPPRACLAADVFDDVGLIVAADGGALRCRALGLRPDLVVGDFDSADAADDRGARTRRCRDPPGPGREGRERSGAGPARGHRARRPSRDHARSARRSPGRARPGGHLAAGPGRGRGGRFVYRGRPFRPASARGRIGSPVRRRMSRCAGRRETSCRCSRSVVTRTASRPWDFATRYETSPFVRARPGASRTSCWSRSPRCRAAGAAC